MVSTASIHLRQNLDQVCITLMGDSLEDEINMERVQTLRLFHNSLLNRIGERLWQHDTTLHYS